ncbi:MAG TPA: nucleotidyltransferase family protein [Ktedonobacterales bacterium]|nr:nucleotidyltransferase family protein [Ktedonobacterales bacterium]
MTTVQESILRSVPWRERLALDDDAGTLLRLCGRRTLAEPVPSFLREIGLRLAPAEWEALLERAQPHGMGPLVFAHAAQAGLLAAMPARVTASLKEAYCRSLVANRVMQEDLATVLAAFAVQGVSAIAVKGVLLAARYYGEAALRPSSDMDLLVSHGNLARAASIVEGLGYAPISEHATLLDDLALRFRQLRFEKAGAPALELHVELSSLPGYHAAFAGRAIWERTEAADCRGVSALCLGRGDELRHLCLHFAVQHAGERLIWLVDIAEAVRSWPRDRSWSAFVDETIALGLATPVAVSLALARDRLGLDVPDAMLAGMAEAMSSPRERTTWRVASLPFSSPERAMRHFLALPSPLERLAFLRSLSVSALRRSRRYLVFGRTWHSPMPKRRGHSEGP